MVGKKKKARGSASAKSKTSKPARPAALKRGAKKPAAKKRVLPVPERYGTVNVQLWFKDAAPALDFYAKAFGAKVTSVMPGPGGKGVMHAEMRVGNTTVMLGDEWPGQYERSPATAQAVTTSLYCYVPNCDALFARAVQAGAKPEFPVADMFWGDRLGKVQDPFGHVWLFATHKEDVPPKEMTRRQEAWFASMGGAH